MSNRLDYETIAGQVSEADTYAKLMEYLRLAEESCYTLGHITKAQGPAHELKGQGWLAVGELLKECK